jgi:hypothetical protein
MEQFWKIRASPLVDKYGQIASFCTASVSLASLVAYKYFDNTTLLQPTTYVIFSYCFVDMFFCKKDLFIHHLLTLSGILFCYIHNVDVEHTKTIYFSMLSTELSSIFLNFNYWLTDSKGTIMKTIQKINFILLIISFTKLRVYDYYYLITNPEIYTIFSKYTENNIIPFLHVFSTILGLFIMNLYWFSIICKMLYKGIIIKYLPKINTDSFAELILQYTFFIQMYPVITRYGNNDAFVYDVFGIAFLGVCSYYYHKTLYNNFKTNNTINYCSNEIIIPYILDTCGIHARSFLVVLTHFLLDVPEKRGRILFTAFFHMAGIFWFLVYLIKMLVKGEKYIYDSDAKEPNYYKTMFYLLLIIPSGIDCLLIVYNTPNISAQMDLLIINVAIAIIVSVHPFYKINHLLVHLALYIQTCILINCNMIMDSHQSPSPYV